MKKDILISTGAGISAESGVHTYRDADGLWTKYSPMEVSHIHGWKTNPQKVIDFKNELRRQFEALNPQPNAAHYALTKLQREWKHGRVTIVTQNIDGLHKKAGSEAFEMHGNGTEKFCEKCGDKTPFDADIVLSDPCRKCGQTGTIRPFVVLFGEMPCHVDVIENLLDETDIYATIGSSCEVMPASLFPSLALGNNATTYLINKEAPERADTREFHHLWYGPATEKVPEWVDMLLAKYP